MKTYVLFALIALSGCAHKTFPRRAGWEITYASRGHLHTCIVVEKGERREDICLTDINEPFLRSVHKNGQRKDYVRKGNRWVTREIVKVETDEPSKLIIITVMERGEVAEYRYRSWDVRPGD